MIDASGTLALIESKYIDIFEQINERIMAAAQEDKLFCGTDGLEIKSKDMAMAIASVIKAHDFSVKVLLPNNDPIIVISWNKLKEG